MFIEAYTLNPMRKNEDNQTQKILNPIFNQTWASQISKHARRNCNPMHNRKRRTKNLNTNMANYQCHKEEIKNISMTIMTQKLHQKMLNLGWCFFSFFFFKNLWNLRWKLFRYTFPLPWGMWENPEKDEKLTNFGKR